MKTHSKLTNTPNHLNNISTDTLKLRESSVDISEVFDCSNRIKEETNEISQSLAKSWIIWELVPFQSELLQLGESWVKCLRGAILVILEWAEHRPGIPPFHLSEILTTEPLPKTMRSSFKQPRKISV